MKYITNSQGWIGKDGNREWAEFDSLMAARRHCIREIAKKRMWANGRAQNDWYMISFGKKDESIQARNDGRINYICVIRGSGGYESYLQILNPKGEVVSPKMSVDTFDLGWVNGRKWCYNYKQ